MLTLAEAKLQLNIAASDTTHDVELQTFVDAATSVVERHTGLTGDVETISGERHVTPHTCKLWLFHRPVQSVTSIARVDGSLTWVLTDLDVEADSGVVRVLTGPLFSGLLEVTYDAGHPVIPRNLNLAARIIVQHLWQTQRGAMDQNVRSAMEDSFGNIVGGGRGYAIPNAALELLGEPLPVIA